MKTRIRLPFALTAAALVFAAHAQEEKEALTERVQALEDGQVKIESYLAAQAKASLGLDGALSAVEKAGFTAGINPESREQLLAALRAQSKARQTGLPGQPAAPVEPPKGRRR